MTVFRLTPAAQRDLSMIWDYTAERWGISQAETYIRDIQGAIERVAEDPHRGRSRENVRFGYFSYLTGSHVVFYKVASKGIEIVRILHRRMDVERHL